MATTMVAPVDNNIALAQKFLPLLDEIYQRESLTSILDTENSRVNWTGADTVNLFAIETGGLANYDRNAGYVPGDTTGSWVPYKLEVDRGRAFHVDAMDNEETLGMMMGNLLSQFERLQVVPEVDAYRFAKWASAQGVTTATATLTASSDVPALIQEAEAQLDNNEVPYEGRILFISPNAYKLMKDKIQKVVVNPDSDVQTNIEMYDDMRVIRVPQRRFNTAVTLNNSTTSAGEGGFSTSGSDINFMIVHPSAILQVVKHNPIRIFSPEQNIEADGYRMNYRIYHDTFVDVMKANGIYVHKATTT